MKLALHFSLFTSKLWTLSLFFAFRNIVVNISAIHLLCNTLFSLYPEEDESGSMSTATPHEPTESEDGDQDKHLLSPPVGSREVAFIRETPRSNVLPE